MISEKRIEELKSIGNHHAFFLSLQTDIIRFVEENRSIFKKAAKDYARLKSDYENKLGDYKNNIKPQNGCIQRQYWETIVTDTGTTITQQRVVYVPEDFPDDPESWFTLFDPFEYGPFSGYSSINNCIRPGKKEKCWKSKYYH